MVSYFGYYIILTGAELGRNQYKTFLSVCVKISCIVSLLKFLDNTVFGKDVLLLRVITLFILMNTPSPSFFLPKKRPKFNQNWLCHLLTKFCSINAILGLVILVLSQSSR